MDAMMTAATPGICAAGVLAAWLILASPYLILRSLLRRQRPPRPLVRQMAQNQVRRHRQRAQPRLVLVAPPNGNHRRSLRRT